MGLIDLFRKKYDMDTLKGINAIPVPAKDYNTGDPTKDCIYYLLQRKATEHAKNGNMDLAIACLRKSNALSDYEVKPLLLEKDYLRLVKYIAQTGDLELAEEEAQKIYMRHPEFKDKRIGNKVRIVETISNAKNLKTDLIYVTSSNQCSVCKKYNRQIYSISGKSKDYPLLPTELKNTGGICPKCILGFSLYYESL